MEARFRDMAATTSRHAPYRLGAVKVASKAGPRGERDIQLYVAVAEAAGRFLEARVAGHGVGLVGT
jgi:hypothetical protein